MKKLRFQGTVHILPNLFTAANLALGIRAITLIFKGGVQDKDRYEQAAVCIMLAMLFDVFDGLVARLTNTTSRFGMEFDSLADVVSFGVAPAVMVYSVALNVYDTAYWKGPFALGFLIVAIYTGCAALRLARFNSRIEDETKAFSGLPSPAAAGVIASYFMLIETDLIPRSAVYFMNHWLLPFAVVGVGVLMVSRIRYPALAKQILWRRHQFTSFVCVAGIIALMIASGGATLFVLFTGYTLYGIVAHLRRKPVQIPDAEPTDDADFYAT